MQIIGHRGASHDAPENTRESVELAWEQNADGAEIDIRLTRDGAIIALHDVDTKRTTGTKLEPAKSTLAELRELDAGSWKSPRWKGVRIPTLEEILATIPDGRFLFIEIKIGPEIAHPLARALQRSKVADRTRLISFNRAALSAAKRLLPEIPAYFLAELKQDRVTQQWSPTSEQLLEVVQAERFDGLDLGGVAGLTAPFAEAVHAFPLYTWTVNDAEVARHLRKLGISGVTTDRPGWMREQLRPV
jgi:glycerophosphoryl diester phosphodiesterase